MCTQKKLLDDIKMMEDWVNLVWNKRQGAVYFVFEILKTHLPGRISTDTIKNKIKKN